MGPGFRFRLSASCENIYFQDCATFFLTLIDSAHWPHSAIIFLASQTELHSGEGGGMAGVKKQSDRVGTENRKSLLRNPGRWSQTNIRKILSGYIHDWDCLWEMSYKPTQNGLWHCWSENKQHLIVSVSRTQPNWGSKGPKSASGVYWTVLACFILLVLWKNPVLDYTK